MPYQSPSNRMWLVHRTHAGVWMSLYIGGLIFTIAVATAFTYTIGELDWDDNIIKNKFGFNSLCLVLDYPPIIYFGPFMYSLCLYCMVPYMVVNYVRIKSLYIAENFTPLSYYSAMTSIFLEFILAAGFSTIFAVNDESVELHVNAFCMFAFSLIVGSIRRILIDRHLESFKGRTKIYVWTYNIAFIIVVFIYAFGMFLVVNFDIGMWEEMGMLGVSPYIDRIATALLLMQIFSGYFVAGEIEMRFHDLELDPPNSYTSAFQPTQQYIECQMSQIELPTEDRTEDQESIDEKSIPRNTGGAETENKKRESTKPEAGPDEAHTPLE